ncbi:MAG: TrkA C-terminal domain-containing protein [Myxococcota bacterium]
MRDILVAAPVLVLFLVAAAGQLLGRIQVGAFRLGVAGVLFAGLVVGMIEPALALPNIVLELGLALFVYTLGLSAGPALVDTLKTRWRELVLVVIVLVVGAALVWGGAALLGLSDTQRAGLFAGGLTNTPALASIVETARAHGGDAPSAVVAYSLAYPGSVLASLLVLAWLRRAVAHMPHAAYADGDADRGVVMRGARVRQRLPIADLDATLTHHVLVGRVVRGAETHVASPDMVLEPGDVVSLVGHPHDLERAIALCGEPAATELVHDREALDYRRIFVSSKKLAGRTIASLALPQRFGALITRVRRGDTELIGDKELELELGDRVRVLAPPERLPELARFFGDSYRSLGEVDVLTFSAGLAVGLLVGAIPIPLPGGGSVARGQAGGPLVVGLVLGARARSGALVWQLPHGAGTTLRQLGLVLFFPAFGTRAGERFAATVTSAEGLALALSGLALSLVVAAGVGFVAARALKLGFAPVGGLVAGALTQPATLAAACEHAGSDAPETTYAAIVPIAILMKILLAQALLALG